MFSDRYQPAEVEEKIYKLWMDNECFKAEDASTRPPFCVILPPPNVTGQLHIGHALNHTIQDVYVRYKRLKGFNVLWLPGIDHAGIATQAIVEKSLAKEGVFRKDIGREEFINKIWEWKHKYGDQILSQMKRLGNSCDWDRLTFTLDEGVSQAVRRVFLALYKQGAIYRGTRLINWSPKLETALSDIEVEHKDIKGSMWHIKYPIAGTDEFVVVATTRPETLLGDVAVCVHPDDERYKNLVGKKIRLPLTGREIPVIADSYVDPEFGSGVVKITPAHDFNDYAVGVRHELPMINVLTLDGKIIDEFTAYAGLKVKDARKQVVQDLEDQSLLEKTEVHKNSVGHCSRSGCVVEPMLSKQWFMTMEDKMKPALHAVVNGTTEFVPEMWTKTYRHWLENVQDWCISRQLWWGHRIPVWYCGDCEKETVIEVGEPSACDHCGSSKLKQDEDVLDTWFSSALWPFTTLGWPEKTESLKTFYPSDIMVTGSDIIFFWIARMMAQGIEFMKDVPFRKVYFNSLVRDSQGRKMSKSLGNSIDPVGLIESHGADALRFTLLAQLSLGKDIKFSQTRFEGYRNFMNKIWNGARFALNTEPQKMYSPSELDHIGSKSHYSVYDQWLVSSFEKMLFSVEKNLENDKLGEAAQDIYSFVWHEFCDWYIELSKIRLYKARAEEQEQSRLLLFQIWNRLCKVMHPFIPFISEEIYQHLPLKDVDILATAEFPSQESDKNWMSSLKNEVSFQEVENLKSVISAIRNIRGENRLGAGVKIKAYLVPEGDLSQKILGQHEQTIMRLCMLETMDQSAPTSLKQSAVADVNQEAFKVKVVIPLAGLVDMKEEVARLEKNRAKVDNDIQLLSGKLKNKKYLQNAPEDLVLADKLLLEKQKQAFEKLSAQLLLLQETD